MKPTYAVAEDVVRATEPKKVEKLGGVVYLLTLM